MPTDIPPRGPGSLTHCGDGQPSSCVKCNWRGIACRTEDGELDNRCPSCEISVETEAEWQAMAAVVAAKQVGRNDPCPCGSGHKSKKCCGR